MGLIPEDKIAEIRDRTDIVQVIGEYVTLKRSGANHKGLCPFHQEKSPSFNVNAPKQFFHCFGCGKSGDVLTFLGELEGKSFVETARELARRAGIELPEAPRSREAVERARAAESERTRLVRLNELVADWFRSQLSAPAGEQARAYVEGRGIGAKTSESFRLGYAPAGWDALTRFLEARRVPHELAERAGLIRRRDRDRDGAAPPPPAAGSPPSKATHFDQFVDRVVYPLTSPMGEVLGFGGRVLDPEAQPKYKNSPETLLYKKGENLFGLHLAKHAIRRGGRALVVEGNFDVMTLHEHGIDFVVAPQGTAITEGQIALLQRFASEVVLMLDADPAGRAATLKVVRLLAQIGMPARIASLRPKDGKKVDPDDLARHDLARLQQLIDTAQDAVEFFFDQVAATCDGTVPGRVAAIEECAGLLREIRDPLARDLYVDRLAGLLKVKPAQVQQALRGGGRSSAPTRPSPDSRIDAGAEQPPAATPQRRIAIPHAKLIGLLAHHPALVSRIGEELEAAIRDPAVRELVAQVRRRGALDAATVVAECAPEIRRAVARALLADEFALDDPKVADKVFDEVAAAICLPTDRSELEAERKKALEVGDLQRVQKLNARIRSLSTRMQQGESSR